MPKKILNFNQKMKIRNGFVSNSSTSSFLIVGTEDDTLIDMIIKAKKLTKEEIEEEMSFGMYESGDINFYGSEEICYAGAELDEKDLDVKPLLFMKQDLVNILKNEYKITVPIEKIHLIYGECGCG